MYEVTFMHVTFSCYLNGSYGNWWVSKICTFCLWELILMTPRQHILLLSLIWPGHNLPPVQYHTRKCHYDTRIKYKQYEKTKQNKLPLFLSRHEFIEGVHLWKIFILNCFPIIHIPRRIQRKHWLLQNCMQSLYLRQQKQEQTTSSVLEKPANLSLLSFPIQSCLCFAWVWSLQAWPICRHTWCSSQNQTTLALYLPAHPAPFYLCGKGGSLFFFFFNYFVSVVLFWLLDFEKQRSLDSMTALLYPFCSPQLIVSEILACLLYAKNSLHCHIWVLDSAYYYTFTI